MTAFFLSPESGLLLAIVLVMWLIWAGINSVAGGISTSSGHDEFPISVKHHESKNGKIMVGKAVFDKTMMLYVADIVRKSDGKKVGMVTGDNQQEMEDWLEKELEWYGERAVVEEMISSDGQFKVRKIGYNDEYHEYEAYIDRVSDDRYVRTVRAKTIDNLGDKAKNVWAVDISANNLTYNINKTPTTDLGGYKEYKWNASMGRGDLIVNLLLPLILRLCFP